MKKKITTLIISFYTRVKQKIRSKSKEFSINIRGDTTFLKVLSLFSLKKILFGAIVVSSVATLGILYFNNPKKVDALSLPSGGGVNFQYSGGGTVSWSDGETSTANFVTVNGEVVFCINPFVDVFEGAYATAVGQSDAAYALWHQMTTYQQNLLNNVAYLGQVNNAKNNSDSNFGTQLAMWMIQAGQNGIPGSIDSTPNIDGSKLNNVFGGRTITSWTSSGAGANAISFALTILRQAAEMGKTPNFNPNPLTVIAGRSATTTDTNGVLSGGAGGYALPFNHVIPTSGLTANVSGNNVIVSALKTAKGSGSIAFYNNVNTKLPHFIYGTINPGGTVGQELFATSDPAILNNKLLVNVIPLTSHRIIKKGTGAGGQQTSTPIPGTKFKETVKRPDGSVDTEVHGTFDTIDLQGNKTGTVTFNKGVAINLTTGSDGSVGIKLYAPEGDTFEDVELSVPTPFILGHTNSQGKLVNDPITGTFTSQSITASTFTDNKQVGSVKLHKSGVLSGNDMLNSEYSLAGMVFGIKDPSGNTVAQMTTNANGDAVSSDTPTTSPLIVDGKTEYSVYEISVPENSGFISTFKPVKVTFSYAGETVVINYQNAAGDNQEITITDNGEKHDAATDAEANGDETVLGTQYGYYYAEDVKNSTGTVIHKANDLVSMTDGFSKAPITITKGKLASKDNKLIVQVNDKGQWEITGLPVVTGGYYRKEVQAGWGEVLSSNKYYFGEPKSEEKNADEKTGIISDEVKPVNDTMIYGIAWQKMFENNSSLTGENGAKFSFKSVNGKFETEVVSGDSSGFDGFTTPGMVKVSGIPIGKTLIHQTLAPEGTTPVDDIMVDFGEVSTNGAPDNYTVTVTWASGSNKGHVLYTKTMPKTDFVDQAVMFNVNFGVLTDKPITPPDTPATIQGITQVQGNSVVIDDKGIGTVKDLYQAIASGSGKIEGSSKSSKIEDDMAAKVIGVYNRRTKEVIPATGEAKLISTSPFTKQAIVEVKFNVKDAKKGVETNDMLTMLEELVDTKTGEKLHVNTSNFEKMTKEEIINETVKVSTNKKPDLIININTGSKVIGLGALILSLSSIVGLLGYKIYDNRKYLSK